MLMTDTLQAGLCTAVSRAVNISQEWGWKFHSPRNIIIGEDRFAERLLLPTAGKAWCRQAQSLQLCFSFRLGPLHGIGGTGAALLISSWGP